MNEVLQMNTPKKILILTCSHGSGHKMVANTLSRSFQERGAVVRICDLFDEVNHPVNQAAGKAYLLSYSGIGKASYKKMYDHVDSCPDSKAMHRFWALTRKTLLRVLEEVRPDCIVNVYPYTVSAMLKSAHYPDIPVFSVVTDFCMPSPWMHPDTDKYYVACTNVTRQLLTMGVPHSKILETGIPIRDAFYKATSRRAVQKKYHLDPGRKTLMLFAGTYGVLKNMEEICQALDALPGLQTIVITGKNQKLHKKLDRLSLVNTQISGFIPDIHELYRTADMLITKPGGISLSEVIAAGIPLILYQPTPGQEGGNAAWFKERGAAIVTQNQTELLVAVKALKDNEIQQYSMKNALKAMNYGHSASLITDDILSLLETRHPLLDELSDFPPEKINEE